MADKTPKADALRRMRETQPARIGPFRIKATKPDPYGRPKWKAELARDQGGKKQSATKRKGKR